MTSQKQHLFHAISGGKSGFVDRNGQVVIDFEFEEVSSFSEGLARIFIGEKTGFIDSFGNIKIQPKFDMALNFSEGLAVVRIGDKEGYINTKGEVVIKPVFYSASNFENGIALVMKDIMSTGCFIDKNGEVKLDGRDFLISKFREGLINCSDKGNWGHVNLEGEFAIPPMYQHTREFSEGKAAVSPRNDAAGKPEEKKLFGFIDRHNQMVIQPIFQGSDIRFSEGLCAVWNNGYGYINEVGELVIPYDFYLGEHFSQGLAVFKPKGKNKKYGFIDKTGKVVIEPIFSSAENFENGLAAVVVEDRPGQFKWGLIDQNGDYVWEPTR